MKHYYVYVMSNVSKMLYVGVTNNLQYRVAQHKKKLVPGFTQRYKLFKLVHFEEFTDVRAAIHREKELKGWLRSKKVAVIVRTNPERLDLAADWFLEAETRRAPSPRSRSAL